MGAERLKVTSHQKKTVGALISGTVLLVLTQTAISPAFPAIMAEMGVDAATVQWLTSAYALTEAVVIPTAAWFMGRFDTRKLYAALVFMQAILIGLVVLMPVYVQNVLGYSATVSGFAKRIRPIPLCSTT